ncbi:winged helix-turn-helix transcriptional regulator [Actinoplanes sp. CA-142083]|uniref:winged helix-turn-helix transcriptional regulator n=1 Tax=Actinoplanes sp. CA-142083 TaxID=3239903 RepID=UPI003D8DE98F
MQKRYHSAVEVTADLIGGKSRVVVLAHLHHGVRRDADLRRRMPDVGEMSLVQLLRELEVEGLVQRRELPGHEVEFDLTEEGRTLAPVLQAMHDWGVTRAQRHDLVVDEPGRADTRRLAAASLAQGDATGWFEKLYVEAGDGRADVPWDRAEPSANLLSAGLPRGEGRRALVVGCGLGRDSEYVAALGYATTAFDISETAIRTARSRHPDSPVDYRVADLLAPPGEWRHGFDLVVESNNVQALPRDLRERATASVAGFVAPGGTLLVLAAAAKEPSDDGPPWPLTREEVDAFARDGLRAEAVEEIETPDDPLTVRWRATFSSV